MTMDDINATVIYDTDRNGFIDWFVKMSNSFGKSGSGMLGSLNFALADIDSAIRLDNRIDIFTCNFADFVTCGENYDIFENYEDTFGSNLVYHVCVQDGTFYLSLWGLKEDGESNFKVVEYTVEQRRVYRVQYIMPMYYDDGDLRNDALDYVKYNSYSMQCDDEEYEVLDCECIEGERKAEDLEDNYDCINSAEDFE